MKTGDLVRPTRLPPKTDMRGTVQWATPTRVSVVWEGWTAENVYSPVDIAPVSALEQLAESAE